MEMIYCVKAESVKSIKGFNDRAWLTELLDEEWIKKPRKLVEEDSSFKQLIPYTILFNREMNLVFSYLRSAGDHRLVNKFSIGVGGHFNIHDLDIQDCVRREIREELGNVEISNYRIAGVLNIDDDPVSSVHLGIIGVASLTEGTVEPRKEIDPVGFIHWNKLKDVEKCYDSELWTSILILNMKKILGGLR